MLGRFFHNGCLHSTVTSIQLIHKIKKKYINDKVLKYICCIEKIAKYYLISAIMLQEFTSTMQQRDDLQASWRNIIVGSEEPI